MRQYDSSGTEPLIVIDGVPVEKLWFECLDFADIEYVEVLKDANATAIYGSRAAHGVIIVTTKKVKYRQTSHRSACAKVLCFYINDVLQAGLK